LGSTSVTTGRHGGSPVRQWYEPYGEVRWSTGGLPTDYGFTGQRWDDSIRLIQMGARWYDARIGRWISADTIVPVPANPRNFNRYTYCGDNPVIFVDPTGHMQWPGDGGESNPQQYRVRPWEYQYLLTPEEQTCLQDRLYPGPDTADIFRIAGDALSGIQITGEVGEMLANPKTWRDAGRLINVQASALELGIVWGADIYEYGWGRKQGTGIASTEFASAVFVDGAITVVPPLVGAAVGATVGGPPGMLVGTVAGEASSVVVSAVFRDQLVLVVDGQVMHPFVEWQRTHPHESPEHSYWLPYYGPTNSRFAD
ncbi:MAG: RHS repeat-associated core domain-containing protein, partial [Chloroflexi bacterium]|nr:RHS repeat-associated core domain-containing protein [Chloroflexota bacterium]